MPPPVEADPIELEHDRTQARRFVLLAVASLVVAGLFSLVLVIARLPGISHLVTDPLFARRGLVVHVDLALVVWFYAFVAGLAQLSPTTAARGPLSRPAPWIAGAGVLTFVLAAWLPGAAPILSNYVPMIDHPLHAAGLVIFGVGVAFSLLDGRLLPGNEAAGGLLPLPAASRVGLRAASLLVLLAGLTFAAAVLVTPSWVPAETYWEVVNWGGGHVLQFASVAAMLSVWFVLLGSWLGRTPLSRDAAVALFGVLLAPALIAPLLAFSSHQATLTGLWRIAFTEAMRFGIFPVVLVALGFCVRAIVRARKEGVLPPGAFRDARFLGFAASAGLTLLGFALGAAIRGSNTMVPAHYHASIGAVTAAFMAVSYHLLVPLGLAAPTTRQLRLAAWQPMVFGVGQAVFALGFGLAGAHGMGRKLYGAEQAARTLPETIGLGVMGAGGLVAVVGGVLFLAIVLSSWRRAPKSVDAAREARTRSAAWPAPTGSIP